MTVDLKLIDLIFCRAKAHLAHSNYQMLLLGHAMRRFFHNRGYVGAGSKMQQKHNAPAVLQERSQILIKHCFL